jgi:hypothetical protein
MNEAIIILMNMRGGCATVGEKVHALFKVNNNRRRASDLAKAADRLDAQGLGGSAPCKQEIAPIKLSDIQ